MLLSQIYLLEAPGKLNGLYMKKQFQDVFANPLDNIFLPSWNEFNIGPMEFTQWDISDPYFHSMGAEGDPEGYAFFLDGYGAYRSRTIEPSVQDNGRYYKLLQSCLRVARVLRIWEGANCTSTEECCQYEQDEYFTNVWSVSMKNGSDTLLSTDKQEVANLTSSGNWIEMCNPWTGTTDFCDNPNAPWNPVNNYDVIRGPFLLHTNQFPNTTSLYRCKSNNNGHLFSTRQDCEGLGTVQSTLGYISTKKSSLTPRSLHRCHSGTMYYHTVDGPCKTGDKDEGILGFVV